MDTRHLMYEAKFYGGYSRYIEDKGRYETWEESVGRVMDMHREFYKDKMTDELSGLIDFAEQKYQQKKVVGSQRALQFGGPQIFAHQARLFNCSFTYIDRPRVFQEIMYALLCGCGCGFSVQKHHVAKLPPVRPRYGKKSKVFTIEDNIQAWADAFGVLISSYMEDGGTFPEYKGCHIAFNFSKIRPKGAFISGGFKAPGSEGLRQSLSRCEELLDRWVDEGNTALAPIVAYDYIMHMSDAVLSGGVRRSATLCLFSKDDEQMMNAKRGNWFIDQPQRGRSNNSVLLVRDETTAEEFHELMQAAQHSGDPGVVFAANTEQGFNPCVTI